jgi:hypothetical protein
MKLVFTKLETDANEIKVTFNGSIWRPYNVADIKKTGYIEFTEEDCPDLTKIRVMGKFASFNSVEAVSDVELEQGTASRSLAESVQRIDSFISSTASETNKLADKEFVNSSIESNTAVQSGITAQLVDKLKELEKVHVTDTYSPTSSDAMSGKAVSAGVIAGIDSQFAEKSLTINFNSGWHKDGNISYVKCGSLYIVYVNSIYNDVNPTEGTTYTIGTYDSSELPGRGKTVCGTMGTGAITGIVYFNKGEITYRAFSNARFIIGNQTFIIR